MDFETRSRGTSKNQKNYFAVDTQSMRGSTIIKKDNFNDQQTKLLILWVFEEENQQYIKNYDVIMKSGLRRYITKFSLVEKFKSFLESQDNAKFYKENKVIIIISHTNAKIIKSLLKEKQNIEKIKIFYETTSELNSISTEFGINVETLTQKITGQIGKISNISADNNMTNLIEKLTFLTTNTINTMKISSRNESPIPLSRVSRMETDFSKKSSLGMAMEKSAYVNTVANETNENDIEEIDMLVRVKHENVITDSELSCQEFLLLNFYISFLEKKENVEDAKEDFLDFCSDIINKDESLINVEDFKIFKGKFSERKVDNVSIIKYIAKNIKFYNFFNKILIENNSEKIFKMRFLLFMAKADLVNLRPKNSIASSTNDLASLVDKQSLSDRENQRIILYKKSTLSKDDLKVINSNKNFPILTKGFISTVDNCQYLINSISSKNFKKVSLDNSVIGNGVSNEEFLATTTICSESIIVIFYIEMDIKIFNDKKHIIEFENSQSGNNTNLTQGNILKMTSFSNENESSRPFDVKSYLILNNLFLIFNKVKVAKYYHEVLCSIKTFVDVRSEFNSGILNFEGKFNSISNKNYGSDIFYMIDYYVTLMNTKKADELLKNIKVDEEETFKSLANISNSSSASGARKSIREDPNVAFFREPHVKNLIMKFYFLGSISKLMEKENEAMQFYNKALKISEPIENKKIKLTITDKDIQQYYYNINANIFFDLSKINLNIYNEKKNIDNLNLAFENIEKSIEKRRKLYPEKSKEIADCLNIKGIIFKNTNRLEEANELYNICMQIKKEIFDENDIELISVYNNFGNLLSKRGNFDEALTYYQKTLEICLKNYQGDHIDTADCYSNIGNTFHSKGDNRMSIENHNKSLKIYFNVLGKDHTLTAITYINLGLAHYAMGDWENSLKNYEKSLEIEKVIHGDWHADTANCYNNIGNVYNNLRQYDKAIENLKKCLEIRLKTVGDEDTETANSYNNLGNVYLTMEDFENALKYYNSSLKIKMKKNGEKSPDTACAMNNIGLVHLRKDDFDLALEFFRKSFHVKVETLGKNHPSTVRTKANIEMVEKILEEIEKEQFE